MYEYQPSRHIDRQIADSTTAESGIREFHIHFSIMAGETSLPVTNKATNIFSSIEALGGFRTTRLHRIFLIKRAQNVLCILLIIGYGELSFYMIYNVKVFRRFRRSDLFLKH